MEGGRTDPNESVSGRERGWMKQTTKSWPTKSPCKKEMGWAAPSQADDPRWQQEGGLGTQVFPLPSGILLSDQEGVIGR